MKPIKKHSIFTSVAETTPLKNWSSIRAALFRWNIISEYSNSSVDINRSNCIFRVHCHSMDSI